MKLEELNDIWKKEREELDKAKNVQELLDQAIRDLEIARQKGDFATAGELQHGKIPNLEHQLQELENETDDGFQKEKTKEKKHKMLAEYVSAGAIATCVATHTGIPVARLTGSESKKLLTMESKLQEVRKSLNVSCANRYRYSLFVSLHFHTTDYTSSIIYLLTRALSDRIMR